MNENLTILLDMDEVIVDFTGGACLVHGLTREQMERERQQTSLGVWALESPMGYAKGLGRPLTIDEFWEPIHEAGERFWVDLQPLPWHADLIDQLAIKFGSRWDQHFYVVTGPLRLLESYSGKARWLKNYFGSHFDRFCPTTYKELFARDNTVLIDDREENCRKFIAAGGSAILFPSRGNQLHAYADDPVPFVRHCLNQF